MSATCLARIVVGVDGHQGGRDALALATRLGGGPGGELVALYAYPYDRSVPLEGDDAVEAALQKDLLAKVQGEVTRAGAAARPVVVADASPARALHAAAEREHADLIVVGAPHRSGAERILGGDVAASTMHGAPCPVAVAPPAYASRLGDLLTVGAGFDGSPESRAALALAHRLAGDLGAKLRPYTVVAPTLPMWPGTSYEAEWRDLQDVRRDRARAKLRAALEEIGDDGAGYAVCGDPGHELARRSAHLDLLVVGSRCYGPLRRLILGSTSHRLIREAQCPVLVLPRGAAAPDAHDGQPPSRPAQERATASA